MSEKLDVTMGEMTKTNGKSGRKVPKKIIWTIGAVAVAAIILIIGICSGAFLSRSNRILLAARNTIKDLPTVVENRNVADIIASGKYTIGVKGAVRGKDFDGTFKYKDTQLQAGGTISLFGRENLDFLAKNWLVDKSIAMFSVIGVETWREVGLNMVIFLAGLQMIDNTYYEAAEIDGAGFFSKLRYIILPLLSSSIVVNTILNLIHGLRVFDIVFSLTGGGPGNATEVLATAVFRTYSAGRMGCPRH